MTSTEMDCLECEGVGLVRMPDSPEFTECQACEGTGIVEQGACAPRGAPPVTLA